MTRILFYGGCHALVLCDLFAELFDPATLEASHLTNFLLIGSGQPFPLERLDACDVLIYTPIENKGSYNTDLLAADCRARGVKALCIPWMEWHGYCPGAVKGLFKGRFQWYFPKLLDLAEQFTTFHAFVDHVVARFPDDDIIDMTGHGSRARIAEAEDRHEMPITISSFIAENFRSSRLFLISDHPSLALYFHVIDQIVALLGLPQPSHRPCEEPQWRWRTPIFPRVAERLGLTFRDTDWVDDELIPGRISRLESYLGLYYHKESVILGPEPQATLCLESGAPLRDAVIDWRTRILANRVTSNESTGLDTYDMLETLSGPEVALPPNARFAIEPARWRSTWAL